MGRTAPPAPPPMLFVLDNYDSFTFNLVQRFGEIDPSLDVVVERNDAVTLERDRRAQTGPHRRLPRPLHAVGGGPE